MSLNFLNFFSLVEFSTIEKKIIKLFSKKYNLKYFASQNIKKDASNRYYKRLFFIKSRLNAKQNCLKKNKLNSKIYSFILMNSCAEVNSFVNFQKISILLNHMKTLTPFMYAKQNNCAILQDLGSENLKTLLQDKSINYKNHDIDNKNNTNNSKNHNINTKNNNTNNNNLKIEHNQVNIEQANIEVSSYKNIINILKNTFTQFNKLTSLNKSKRSTKIPNRLTQHKKKQNVKKHRYIKNINKNLFNYKKNISKIKSIADNIGQYSIFILLKELNIFKYYIQYQNQTQVIDSKIWNSFLVNMENLLSNLKIKKTTLTLRDLHAENIMLFNNKKINYKIKDKKLIYVDSRDYDLDNNQSYLIDYQDAIKGSIVYDLVSLLDDARRHVRSDLQKEICNYFAKIFNCNLKDLIFDYAILSIQRNLRILGVFVAQHVKFHNSNYLQYLDLVKGYLLNSIKNLEIILDLVPDNQTSTLDSININNTNLMFNNINFDNEKLDESLNNNHCVNKIIDLNENYTNKAQISSNKAYSNKMYNNTSKKSQAEANKLNKRIIDDNLLASFTFVKKFILSNF